MTIPAAFPIVVGVLISAPMLWAMRRDFIDATRQTVAVRHRVKGHALRHWAWLLLNQP